MLRGVRSLSGLAGPQASLKDAGGDSVEVLSVPDMEYHTSFNNPGSGNVPIGLAFDDHAGNLLSLEGENAYRAIYIHDGVSSTVLTSFATPETSPRGLAFDTSTGNLISGSNTSDLIYVHDGVSSTVLSSFATPANDLSGLAVDPFTGNLLSCDDDANAVYIHDGVSATVLSTLTMVSSPTGVAVDPLTGNLAVCRPSSSGPGVFIYKGISDELITSYDVVNSGISAVAFDDLGQLITMYNSVTASQDRIYVYGRSEGNVLSYGGSYYVKQ